MERVEVNSCYSGLNTSHAEAKSGLEFGLLQLVIILILFFRIVVVARDWLAKGKVSQWIHSEANSWKRGTT